MLKGEDLYETLGHKTFAEEEAI